MKPVIINKLPEAIIFPESATIPPIIIAKLLRPLVVAKPKRAASVGIINAPEKIVSAMSSDWMIEWMLKARRILSRPITTIIILVFRTDFWCLNPSDKGSPIIVAEVSNVVEPVDMTAESNAATSKPIPHSGNVFIITGISAELLSR